MHYTAIFNRPVKVVSRVSIDASHIANILTSRMIDNYGKGKKKHIEQVLT